MKHFTCTECGRDLDFDRYEFTTGYGVNPEEPDSKICYDCCAKGDLARMLEDGVIYLYLDCKARTVTNWPGSLKFAVGHISKGRHNMARVQRNFWFRGQDGFLWWGRQVGDWTQIARCKRIKEECTPQDGIEPYAYANV